MVNFKSDVLAKSYQFDERIEANAILQLVDELRTEEESYLQELVFSLTNLHKFQYLLNIRRVCSDFGD